MNNKKQEQKTYYSVMELSEAFNIAMAENKERGTVSTPELHLWQVKFQLAIAQQLTVISKHLGDFLTLLENQVGKK